MSTLFDFEKRNFAECHIFVNGVDFEVIDCPIFHSSPDYHSVEARVRYWKQMGFSNVRYDFVRVVEKLVFIEGGKSYETKKTKK